MHDFADAGVDPPCVRLEHAKPRYGEDIFDTTLPQETRQTARAEF